MPIVSFKSFLVLAFICLFPVTSLLAAELVTNELVTVQISP
ncbi:MAG: hypothetical protein ACI834_000694, partial [Colwellia sp.]